jgi:hypothetical protein
MRFTGPSPFPPLRSGPLPSQPSLALRRSSLKKVHWTFLPASPSLLAPAKAGLGYDVMRAKR